MFFSDMIAIGSGVTPFYLDGIIRLLSEMPSAWQINSVRLIIFLHFHNTFIDALLEAISVLSRQVSNFFG